MQLCGSLSILWHCLSLGLEWKLTFFQSCGHCWVFQIYWHFECSTFTASSFRIWNSSTGIPSLPLALFVVMLSKAHLASHSRMSGLGEWSHHRDYLGREDFFVQFFHEFLPPLLKIFCFCPYHFCPLLSPSLHEMYPCWPSINNLHGNQHIISLC